MHAGSCSVWLSGRCPSDTGDPVMDSPQKRCSSVAGGTSAESQHFWVSGSAPSEKSLGGTYADDALCNGCNGSQPQCCLVADESACYIRRQTGSRPLLFPLTPPDLCCSWAHCYSGLRSGWAHTMYSIIPLCFLFCIVLFCLGPAARGVFDLRQDFWFHQTSTVATRGQLDGLSAFQNFWLPQGTESFVVPMGNSSGIPCACLHMMSSCQGRRKPNIEM